ncbi:Cysteine-rich secretory protein family protein [Devosia crocina]|uniref:Cysteine-rich secretory protein family protein n=1 Tax=Devosia crocina TaxID=429728 RepID=A0A1I7NDR6_9HYPH|nr:CAP domain-containing protein [Devosia crocina]SFV32789.1 Cysteine-rich secretory protein family protein [Devosia crocina]
MTTSFTRLAAAAGIAILAATAMTGCSMMGAGGGGSAASLPNALTARMDQPGAVLDRRAAIELINSYRGTRGVAPLSSDTGLDGTAQALANQYAQTGNAPATPQGLVVMKLSAGYSTIADTFSGWRNSPADAAGLAAQASKAGIAVAFNASSGYGVYWVLVLGN